MLKVVNPYVVKIVGATAAMLFQHITYWMQTQKKEIIFRTNAELSLDLEECLSIQQVQRAKKKLIDNGLIEVSFDKVNKWIRTTHYSLTQKGKLMMLKLKNIKSNIDSAKGSEESSNDEATTLPHAIETHHNFNDNDVGVVIVPEGVKDSNSDRLEPSSGTSSDDTQEIDTTVFDKDGDVSFEDWLVAKQKKEEVEKKAKQEKPQWIPKEEYKKMKQQERIDLVNNKEPIVPNSMQESFKEGFKGNKNATTIPEHLLNNPKLAKMFARSKRKLGGV